MMTSLRRSYLALGPPQERLEFLLRLIESRPEDAEGRRRRYYAVRLLGSAASESDDVARRALPIVLQLGRTDPDPLARAMAVGALIGVQVPLQSSTNPEFILYFDPEEHPGDSFDQGFPSWARDSEDVRSMLRELSARATAPAARLAALRARAWMADEESVGELGAVVKDASESLEIRQGAAEVLYRRKSPAGSRIIEELSLGLIPGLPREYQVEALRHQIREGQIDARQEVELRKIVSDPELGENLKKVGLTLAIDLYRVSRSQGSRSILLEGCASSSRDVRLQAVSLIASLADPVFVKDLEQRRSGENNTYVLDTIDAALNGLDPQSPPRPSLTYRMVMLQQKLRDEALPDQERMRLLGELDRVRDGLLKLEKQSP